MRGLSSDEFVTLEFIDVDRASNVRFAYIKELTRDETANIIAFDPDANLGAASKLYAVRADDGKLIGITDSWTAAYWTALSNDFSPLSVH